MSMRQTKFDQKFADNADRHVYSGPDVKIENHGSIVMVRPVSQAAKDWVEENVPTEGWQWMGSAFSCEPRYVDDLVAGMQADGLTVV